MKNAVGFLRRRIGSVNPVLRFQFRVILQQRTRKPVHRWKRGFWEIAHQANVPIVPSFLDFKNRKVYLGEAIWTTDDAEADILKIRRLYKKEMAKMPENFIEVEN